MHNRHKSMKVRPPVYKHDGRTFRYGQLKEAAGLHGFINRFEI